MNLSSNVCTAWFCRSTRPFKTFLVSINGHFGWFWPSLLLYYPDILHITLSLPRTGIKHVGISEFHHARTYLSQIRIKCGTLWRLVFWCTRPLAGYFTTHAFHLDAPYTKLPLISMGFCLESDCPAKKIMINSSEKTFTFCWYVIPIFYLSTLTKAHSLPVCWIISWCPIDQIQVASDSAIGTSWFWSASRIDPIWQLNSSMGLFENHYRLKSDRIDARISLQIR